LSSVHGVEFFSSPLVELQATHPDVNVGVDYPCKHLGQFLLCFLVPK